MEKKWEALIDRFRFRIGSKVIIKERAPFLASAVFPKEVLNCVGTVTSRSGSCAFVDFKGRSIMLSIGWLTRAERITGRLKIGDI